MRTLVGVLLVGYSASAMCGSLTEQEAMVCNITAQFAMNVATQRNSGIPLQSILAGIDKPEGPIQMKVLFKSLGAEVYAGFFTPEQAYSFYLNSCVAAGTKN